MKDAAVMLEKFGIEYEITVVSAHRTPERMYEYAKTAEERGIKVIIAGAGGSAHLPGMTASLTTLPVIAVPIKTSTLNGVDSLYSIVQMPAGIPVASMAINGATNAGIYAAKILSVADPYLSDRISEYMDTLIKTVDAKAEDLKANGYKKYIERILVLDKL
jgi:5-(carboxyamino)imidazole ribonucleotide mutase